MTAHRNVVAAWLEGKVSKGNSMFCNAGTIYSYTTSCPVAHFYTPPRDWSFAAGIDRVALVTAYVPSSSTGQHKGMVVRALAWGRIPYMEVPFPLPRSDGEHLANINLFERSIADLRGRDKSNARFAALWKRNADMYERELAGYKSLFPHFEGVLA